MGRFSPLARWRRFERRHDLPSFIIANCALGALAGQVCVALLLFFDPVGLRPLLLRSDMEIVALAMLCLGFAVTFGGVTSAGAVMLIERDPEGGGTRGRLSRLRPALRRAAVR